MHCPRTSTAVPDLAVVTRLTDAGLLNYVVNIGNHLDSHSHENLKGEMKLHDQHEGPSQLPTTPVLERQTGNVATAHPGCVLPLHNVHTHSSAGS